MLKQFIIDKEIDNFSKADFNKLFTTKRKQYKGFEWKQYNIKSQIKDKLPTYYLNNKKCRERLKAYNYFYVFDCETTFIDENKAVAYLYGLQRFDYSINVNDNNIKQLKHTYYHYQSYKKLAIHLNKLNIKAKTDNKKLVIYIHNLIFDLYELLQNVIPHMTISDYEIENCYNDSIYRGSASKPLVFRVGNLFFIDSYALTNKSLAHISQSHKFKKQTELKTYKEKYFFQSNLPKSELIYNEYDLLVTALGVFDSIKSCNTIFNTFDDFISQNVNTITGLSKYLNKHIYSDNDKNKQNILLHKMNATNNLPFKDNNVDANRLLFYQKVFLGGFTHCNPLFAFRCLKIVISNDKKSDYPQQMMTRLFPYNFKVVEDNRIELLKKYHYENMNYFNHDFINSNLSADFEGCSYYRPCKHYFVALITINNLSIKMFDNNNCMPLIPVSNTSLTNIDIIDTNNFLIDNGKVIKANKPLQIYCTNLDLVTYQMFYDFDIIDCSYLEYTKSVHWLDKYIQDSLRYHLKKKDSINKIIKGKLSMDKAQDFEGNKIYSNEFINNYKSMNKTEQERLLNFEYLSCKMNGVNNQYGLNVQKIINDEIKFNLKKYQYIKNKDTLQGVNNKSTTRDFISGLYITSYARYDLALFTYMIFKLTQCSVIYWDTDSVKTMVTNKQQYKELKKVVNLYNNKFKLIQSYIDENIGYMYGLGIFENDFTYNEFFSMGAKKYLVRIDKKLEITNSGINKHLFSDFLTSKYKKSNNFNDVINQYYHPNIEIDGNIINHLVIKYPAFHQDKVKAKIVDENGKQCIINQFTAPINLISSYKVTDFTESYSNKMYWDFTYNLQKMAGMLENKLNIKKEYING